MRVGRIGKECLYFSNSQNVFIRLEKAKVGEIRFRKDRVSENRFFGLPLICKQAEISCSRNSECSIASSVNERPPLRGEPILLIKAKAIPPVFE